MKFSACFHSLKFGTIDLWVSVFDEILVMLMWLQTNETLEQLQQHPHSHWAMEWSWLWIVLL
jgi:hypothetical protein